MEFPGLGDCYQVTPVGVREECKRARFHFTRQGFPCLGMGDGSWSDGCFSCATMMWNVSGVSERHMHGVLCPQSLYFITIFVIICHHHRHHHPCCHIRPPFAPSHCTARLLALVSYLCTSPYSHAAHALDIPPEVACYRSKDDTCERSEGCYLVKPSISISDLRCSFFSLGRLSQHSQ